MTTKKLLVFLVIVTSIPFAYSRHAPFWDQKLFSRDIFEEKYYSHQPQTESQVNTQNHKPKHEIVDLIKNTVDSRNDLNELQDRQDQQIEIVDVNGNVADLEKNKYKVQRQDNHDLDIDKFEADYEKSHGILVNLEKMIPESQKYFPTDIVTRKGNSRQNVRSTKNQVYSQNHFPDLEIVDINKNVVNSSKGENEVDYQQNEIVDVNGTVVDLEKNKYEVQRQDNHDLDIDKFEVDYEKSHGIVVNLEKMIPESQKHFPTDIVTRKENSRQNIRSTKNQVYSQNHFPDLENVDINKNVVNSSKGENAVEYQQKEIVDVNGNVVDSEKDKYEVKHHDNHEIIVDFENDVPERQNFFPHDIVKEKQNSRQKHHDRHSESQVNALNHKPELEITDINRNVVNSPKGEHELQDQQIDIVDVKGNVVDSEKDKYEVQNHQDNQEIIVDFENDVSGRQNLFPHDIIKEKQNTRQKHHDRHSKSQVNASDFENDVSGRQNLFPDDIVKEKQNSRQKHHDRHSESQVNALNHKPELENAIIDRNVVNSPKGEHELQDQQIEIVDVNGNVVDSEKDKYEVQNHQDNHEIIVDFENDVSGRQNLFPDDIVKEKQNFRQKHHVRRSKSQENDSNNKPEVQIVDINESKVNSSNDEYQVQDHQNPEIQIVSTKGNVMDNGKNSRDREIGNDSGNNVNTTFYKVCQTVECKKLANDFLKSLNKSVDPCENFYKFACSGWEVTKKLPPNEIVYSRIATIQASIKRDIKEMLEVEPKPSDILPIKQAKKWYRSCIDTERIERRGLKPVESIMMQVGGWPIAMDEEEWDETAYTWQSIEHHYARLTGSYVFYDIIADYPSEGYAFGNISIDAPKLVYDQRFEASVRGFMHDTYYDYQQLVSKVIRSFIEHNRATISEERLVAESYQMLSFERELSKLKRAVAMEYYTSFEELIHWYNSNETDSKLGSPGSRINWNELIQGLFNEVNIKVLPSTKVYIKKAGYVKGIGELLKRTPLRTIVNYIHWNFLGNTLAFTTEEMRDLFPEATLKRMSGITENEPRWWECVDEMKMTHVAAYVFAKKNFTQETENAALEIIDNVRMGLEQNIDSSNWLDPESKVFLKDKLNNMKTFVGFPNWYNNKTAIINHYKGITIGADYFDNSLSYMRYNRKHILKRYITPKPEFIPFNSEESTSALVNAIYAAFGNFIGISAAFFLPPIFGKGFPNNVNYASIGSIIGHEMSHGFDQCAIIYNKNGEKTEFNNVTLSSFYQRVECFVEQFDNYEKNPKVVNGTNWNCTGTENNIRTHGQKSAADNIADSTGLQAAFQGYKIFSKKKNPNGDMRLPGLEEFTDDQLFFLSFAEMWCEVDTPIYRAYRHLFDVAHSSPDLRVIGAVSNTKDFAKAFNCPVGSSMNPTNKCSIWDKP